MEQVYSTAAIYLGLAVLSAVIAYHLRISIALIEICVGIAFGAFTKAYMPDGYFDHNADWVRFLAGSGAILLTFLSGAELDAQTVKVKAKEIFTIGSFGFLAPFIGGALVAYYILKWSFDASLLAGISLSTTSMAIVYAVMLDTGLNSTEYGKGIIGSCFLNDVATVLALGLVFAPFTIKTIVFLIASALVLLCLPYISNRLTMVYGNRTAAIRTKLVTFFLFGLAALAVWAESEPVLPAYIAGIILADFAGKDHFWMRRLRTLTIGFLTPFYFIRAGALVSVDAIISAPIIVLILLGSKVFSKIFGLYPLISIFRTGKNERWYYTLLMSTGLTFGSISALYGYTHGIVDVRQYSYLLSAVILSAIVPTAIATIFFLPRHLLVKKPKVAGVKAEVWEE